MIVITGASGHVGNNLVRELNKRGIKPRILIHEETTVRKAIEGLDFEEVKGDTRDLESLKKAFEGADLVYNCAAAISIKCGVYDKIKTVNVDGVQNVIDACIADKVRRLVHVSSIEALGDPGEGVVATEELGFNPDRAMLEYGITKAEGSLLVQKAVKEGKIDAVTVCPVGILGPNDFRPSQMGTMEMNFRKGKLPAYPAYGGFDWVDVRDVVEAIILAGEKGKSGEFYLLTGGHVTNDEMMGILEKLSGRKRPKVSLPYWLMYTMGFLAENCFYRFFKSVEPVITRGSARILKSDLHASSEKAQRELGMKFRNVEEIFRDHYNWMVEYTSGKKS